MHWLFFTVRHYLLVVTDSVFKGTICELIMLDLIKFIGGTSVRMPIGVSDAITALF